MSTIIYLGNQQVQVITGTLSKDYASIKQHITAMAPEGSYINGMIMDPESFEQFIKQLWADNKLPVKDVTLVVNTTKFIGRSMEIPAMKEAKELEYISRDFAESGRGGDEMIYGYVNLGKSANKMKKIYAEGIEAAQIGDYLDIFNQAGIKVKNVYSGESSLIAFTGTVGKNQGYKNYVMLIAEGTSLIQLLFVDGTFYYYNSVRCFQDVGTEDYGYDVARSISQLLQFMKSEQIEEGLDHILIAGADMSAVDVYSQCIKNMDITTPVRHYFVKNFGRPDPELMDYYPAISGLLTDGKMQNFLPRYKAVNNKNKMKAETVKVIASIASVFVVMVVIAIVLLAVRLGKKKELDTLTEYNESPAVMMDVMMYDTLAERNTFLKNQYRSINDLKENINTYPCGNKPIMEVIDKCALGYAQIEYESFNAESGSITISAKAPVVEDINKFIKKLTEQQEFYKVDYTGYVLEGDSGLWNIHVNCTLAESAGRKN